MPTVDSRFVILGLRELRLMIHLPQFSGRIMLQQDELFTEKPLFPGKNVLHQLDLMIDLLETPSPEAIARIRNEKARRYISSIRKKKPIPFSQKFPNADPLALRLLKRMLAFEPKDRPSAKEAYSDSYFKNLAKVEREPSAQPVTKMEFEFERRLSLTNLRSSLRILRSIMAKV